MTTRITKDEDPYGVSPSFTRLWALEEKPKEDAIVYRCPRCSEHTPGEARGLTIHHLITCKTNVAANAEVIDFEAGDLEYNDADNASCECGWSGTVKDMTVPDEEEPS